VESYLSTKQEICLFLNIGPTKLEELLKKGMPFILVGETKRFEKEVVLQWFKLNTENKIKENKG